MEVEINNLETVEIFGVCTQMVFIQVPKKALLSKPNRQESVWPTILSSTALMALLGEKSQNMDINQTDHLENHHHCVELH